MQPEVSASLVPPLTPADARAVAAFANRLRQSLGDHIAEIRLFGSKARGDARPESDIDMLVVVQPEAERVRLETAVSDLAFDVSLEHAVHISPCVLTARVVHESTWRDAPFLQTLEREGLRVRPGEYPPCSTENRSSHRSTPRSGPSHRGPTMARRDQHADSSDRGHDDVREIDDPVRRLVEFCARFVERQIIDEK